MIVSIAFLRIFRKRRGVGKLFDRKSLVLKNREKPVKGKIFRELTDFFGKRGEGAAFLALFFFSSCSPIQLSPANRFVPLTTNLAGGETRKRNRFSSRHRSVFSRPPSEDREFYGKVPLDDHVLVDYWLDHFTEGAGRHHMIRYLERSTRYVPLMQTVLKRNGLPEDLVYVAMVESGFNPTARSNKNAVGFWQFLASTGREYGLRINEFVDERRDMVLSTQAAAQYLKSLYNLFEDWHLALAAYNAGESSVNKAVFNSRNRDYWYLVERKKIPPETRNFVPKIIAFTKIAKDPLKYDFHNLKYQEPLSYDRIRVRESSRLSYIAERLNVPVSRIKDYNPMYLSDYVPVYRGSTYIRIPDEFL